MTEGCPRCGSKDLGPVREGAGGMLVRECAECGAERRDPPARINPEHPESGKVAVKQHSETDWSVRCKVGHLMDAALLAGHVAAYEIPGHVWKYFHAENRHKGKRVSLTVGIRHRNRQLDAVNPALLISVVLTCAEMAGVELKGGGGQAPESG